MDEQLVSQNQHKCQKVQQLRFMQLLLLLWLSKNFSRRFWNPPLVHLIHKISHSVGCFGLLVNLGEMMEVILIVDLLNFADDPEDEKL